LKEFVETCSTVGGLEDGNPSFIDSLVWGLGNRGWMG